MYTCDGSHAASVGTTASVSCPAGLLAKGHDLLLLSQASAPNVDMGAGTRDAEGKQ